MRVGIVGAGAAGLRCAQLFERMGVEVVVFDARDRVGGRIWRTEVGGQTFEAGAEWIDAEHQRVLSLLDELGLPVNAADHSQRRFFFGGQWIPRPSVEVDVTQGVSLADALDRTTDDPRVRAYLEAVALSDEGVDSNNVDLDEWRKFSENYAARVGSEMSAYRLPGDLCLRMAGTLRGDVRLGCELTGVEGVRLSFADGSSEQFDEVVLTLPPPCLERIGLHGFGIEMSPTCKVALAFSQQFWDEGGFMCDLAVQQVWPCGQALVCYINGRGMEELVAGSDPVEEALASLSGVYPEARAYFLAGRLVDWKAERFSLGGFPYVPVGFSRQPAPSEGPVRFAGDWTAGWFGFVEGALESAERVVSEIKNEHGLS